MRSDLHNIDLGIVLGDVPAATGIKVGDLQLDSRQIKPGDAFVAVPGRTSHGLRHVRDALEAGAVAILYDPADGDSGVEGQMAPAVIPVPALASRLGEIADRAHSHPSRDIEVAGITGTNGKTTCAWLYALCRDDRAAYLGTVGSGRPPNLKATTHTTLDVFSLHRTLAAFRDTGAKHAAIEVSSHALDQNRVAGVRMPLVGFTNLSRDHLDYHGSMERYAAAKERIFSCQDVQRAVINIDDETGRKFAAKIAGNIETLSVASSAPARREGLYVEANEIRSLSGGLYVAGASHAGNFALTARLVGQFNAENLLLTLGLLLASGMRLADATERLSRAVPPPGRMEAFDCNGTVVVVDYAHTPDALAKALQAVRGHVRGKLYCVFGCGGDRDSGKRALMAEVAEKFADGVIVTDDNPRSEDPGAIVNMILAGFSNRIPVRVEHDREKAIRTAVENAVEGDVVLIAGKGHEDTQTYGSNVKRFSDREIAQSIARKAA